MTIELAQHLSKGYTGTYGMGIEILEKRFQDYKIKYPHKVGSLILLAKKMSVCQLWARKILDRFTSLLCSKCQTSCCKGMPCDGWFTPVDYFAYRVLYGVPTKTVDASTDCDTWSCSFLTPAGCSLPRDMRPVACVKVNCKRFERALTDSGDFYVFKKVCEEIDTIQQQLWEVIQDEFTITNNDDHIVPPIFT